MDIFFLVLLIKFSIKINKLYKIEQQLETRIEKTF